MQGIWAGGDPKQPEGVIAWAGGITDYKDIYTMYVKSVNVTDFGRGKEYVYGDKTGSWQSIKAVQQVNHKYVFSMLLLIGSTGVTLPCFKKSQGQQESVASGKP